MYTSNFFRRFYRIRNSNFNNDIFLYAICKLHGYCLMSFQTEELYEKLMNIIMRLARYGLIHGDFNEFNIMLTEVRKFFFTNIFIFLKI